MTKTTKCIACKSAIEADAKVCPVCKSYQSSWRNLTAYIAGIAGLFTVFTYVSSNIDAARKNLIPRTGINVLTADTNGLVVIQNIGDKKVYVSSLEYHLRVPGAGDHSHLRPLGATIGPGDTKIFEEPKENKAKGEVLKREQNWSDQQVETFYLQNKNCVAPFFVTGDHDLYRFLLEFLGDGLASLRVTGRVLYYEERSPEKSIKEVPGHLLFYISQEACNQNGMKPISR
jgi:hypothetical protein